MSEKLRILVTGFGPFPGAPYNPTQPLVARLTLAANVVTTAIRLAGLRADIEANEAILATQLSDLAIA